jgi:uncharacterized DUF497 family protein
VRYTWDEAKRLRNLRKHGLDFADVWRVFEGDVLTYEDVRFDYGEQRMIAFGMLDGIVVAVVYVDLQVEIRVISFRGATRHEQDLFYEYAGF